MTFHPLIYSPNGHKSNCVLIGYITIITAQCKLYSHICFRKSFIDLTFIPILTFKGI